MSVWDRDSDCTGIVPRLAWPEHNTYCSQCCTDLRGFCGVVALILVFEKMSKPEGSGRAHDVWGEKKNRRATCASCHKTKSSLEAVSHPCQLQNFFSCVAPRSHPHNSVVLRRAKTTMYIIYNQGHQCNTRRYAPPTKYACLGNNYGLVAKTNENRTKTKATEQRSRRVQSTFTVRAKTTVLKNGILTSKNVHLSTAFSDDNVTNHALAHCNHSEV